MVNTITKLSKMITKTSFTKNENSSVKLDDVKNINVKNFIESHKDSAIKEYTVMSVFRNTVSANIMIRVDAGFAIISGFYPCTFSNILTEAGYIEIV